MSYIQDTFIVRKRNGSTKSGIFALSRGEGIRNCVDYPHYAKKYEQDMVPTTVQ